MTDPIMTLDRVRELQGIVTDQLVWIDLCIRGKFNDHEIIRGLIQSQYEQLSIIKEMLREREAIGEVGRL